jgi:Negative regulator of sigma F
MDNEQLIKALTADLRPVRPLPPPSLRAALWLGVAALLSALVVSVTVGVHVFAIRVVVPRVAWQGAGEALTAVSAVLAAFVRSVPGRSPRWALLPLPGCALWLGASGLGCFANGWGLHGQLGGSIGESLHCFVFILAASVPLGAALFAALLRAHPIDPLPVATLGTLGVAAAAALVLEFFHPFDVTVIDLALHLAAVGVVMALGIGLRHRVLATV